MTGVWIIICMRLYCLHDLTLHLSTIQYYFIGKVYSVCMCICVCVYVYPCAYVPHLKYQDTAKISFSVIFIEVYFPVFLSGLNSHVVWIIFLVIECFYIVQ